MDITPGSTDSSDSNYDPELANLAKRYKGKPVSLQSALIQYNLSKVLGKDSGAEDLDQMVSHDEDETTNESTATETQQPEKPKTYFVSWREILDALDLANSDAQRAKVQKLDKKYDGPITVAGQGAQPEVEKTTLLNWWNELEGRFEELKQREADTEATVRSQHDYGSDGTVVTDIGGSVKHRRSDRKP